MFSYGGTKNKTFSFSTWSSLGPFILVGIYTYAVNFTSPKFIFNILSFLDQVWIHKFEPFPYIVLPETHTNEGEKQRETY